MGTMKKMVMAMATMGVLVSAAIPAVGQAQMMPQMKPACATATGVHPMPGGIPQAGLPCGNGRDHGVTIMVPGPVYPGGMPQGPLGQIAGLPQPQLPPIRPFRPDMFGDNTSLSPGAIGTGRIAGAVGFNHEAQVAASCVAQYGTTYAGAGCVAARLTADELNKCLTKGVGRDGCFGDNNTLVAMLRSNIQGAARESGDLDKAVRATTGISVRDIKEHGICGGPNSFARQLGCR